MQNNSSDYLMIFRELQVVLNTKTALLLILEHPAFSDSNFTHFC